MAKTKLGIVVAVVALAAVACGGGSNAADNDSATTTTAAAAGPVVVHVTATEYKFESDTTTFKAGTTYRFEVTNEGAMEHEFMVGEPIAPGSMDMEEMDGLAIGHIEEDDLQPGQTDSVDVTFTADQVGQPLEFSCHLEGHYEGGMHLPITVES